MESLKGTFRGFNEDYSDYYEEAVPGIFHTPSPCEFLNQYVLTSTPLYLHRDLSISEFAWVSWQQDSHLKRLMANKTVTASVLPAYEDTKQNKLHLDDITEFVIPEEREMKFSQFLFDFRHATTKGRFSLDKQNNLIDECYPLLHSVTRDVPWATDAFKRKPFASNLLMGNKNVPTALHNDPYEILYYVITGKKTFTLYPPCSTLWLPYKTYDKKQWQQYGTSRLHTFVWKKIDLMEKVHAVDQHLSLKNYLASVNVKSFIFTVDAGRALYIPALWFWKAEQSDGHISVNYWYDMKKEIPILQFVK